MRDAVATLLKIQKYELHREPADPSNPTVSAGELVEHLKERRHAKQQRANKIRQLSLPRDSPERLALAAGAPVGADREVLAREATSSCGASSTVAGTHNETTPPRNPKPLVSIGSLGLLLGGAKTRMDSLGKDAAAALDYRS